MLSLILRKSHKGENLHRKSRATCVAVSWATESERLKSCKCRIRRPHWLEFSADWPLSLVPASTGSGRGTTQPVAAHSKYWPSLPAVCAFASSRVPCVHFHSGHLHPATIHSCCSFPLLHSFRGEMVRTPLVCHRNTRKQS